MYKDTNVQKILDTLNWAFLRDISQKLVELLFQWRNIFCTYQQDKKIEFGTEEGLLEKHWQRWFFLILSSTMRL